MSGAEPHDLVVLPPVADDPIFSESLFEATPSPRSRLGEDPHDFAGLYIRHRWSFQLHASRFLHDQRDIDEVVQEGFLKLFLALPELETELQALAYARRTITNLCIDRYRADQRRPRLVDLETIPWHALPEEDDDDPVVAAEDAAIVREALAMLSPLHRDALIKREIEEKALPVIAAELDIPVEQVKHVLHRARRSLRRLLVGTHVEPGVDLDLALVLEANRARAARAAKPTGAAVLAVLLVLAGVFGLRSNTPRRIVAVAPSSAPLGGLIPAPGVAPSVPSGGPVVTPPIEAPARPAASTRVPRSGRPASAVPDSPPKRPVTPSKPVVGGGSVPPVVAPAHPAPYVVTGVGASGAPQVNDQQRALRAAGTTSSSTLSTPTTAGTYALRQAFTFADDRSLVAVVFNEVVPLAGGGDIGTVMTSAKTSVETLEDGAVRIVTTGNAAPVGEVNGVVLGARALTIDVVLAPDLLQVMSESVLVVVSGPVAPAFSEAQPSTLREPDGRPESEPQAATDPRVSIMPPAPPPTASQGPAPIPGPDVLATRNNGVIAQDQGLR